MLKRITIERFKSILAFDEELKAVTVLVGTNNSGKSSVLNAIHSAVAIAQSRLRLADQSPMITDIVGFSISAADTLYLPVVDTGWLAPNGSLTQTNGPKIGFFFDDATASEGSVEILRGKNRNLAVKVRGREVTARIEKIDEPFSVYVPGLAGIARNETFIAKGSLLRAVARGDANLVLRNVLALLHANSAQWKAFGGALREVYPGHYINVRFKPDADEYIAVTVKLADREIPFDCIGTGFLQTTQILSYIYLFRPVVTLLDEPDSHLHPNNQRLLGELLWRLASEGLTRVIMATHSRHVLDVLREKDGVAVKWLRQGKVQGMSSQVDLLTDLGALDSAEGLVSQSIDFVVLTEDKKKQLLLPLFEANGANKGKFQVWAYKGCSRMDIAEALGKFIAEVSPTTKVIVHRDSDYMSDDDKTFYREEYDLHKLSLFLPPTTDIEGLFCRLEHLKALNPGKTADVEAAWNAALAANTAQFRSAAKEGRLQMDDLRHKKKRPTEGAVAIDGWAAAVDLSDERWRHGKDFLGKIRSAYQQAVGANLSTNGVTPHLVVPALQAWVAAAKPPVVAAVVPAVVAPAQPLPVAAAPAAAPVV